MEFEIKVYIYQTPKVLKMGDSYTGPFHSPKETKERSSSRETENLLLLSSGCKKEANVFSVRLDVELSSMDKINLKSVIIRDFDHPEASHIKITIGDAEFFVPFRSTLQDNEKMITTDQTGEWCKSNNFEVKFHTSDGKFIQFTGKASWEIFCVLKRKIVE